MRPLLDQGAPIPPTLPTEADVRAAEEKLGVKFPPSYIKFQLQYSDILFGHYELFHLFQDGSYLDMTNEVKEAREHYELDKQHLLPFVMFDSDYFCFDLKSPALEYEVVYWSHNGATNDRWINFLDWVENCWIKEGLESGDE